MTWIFNFLLFSKQMKGSSKNTPQKAAKTCAVVQKRPVRPILPALYNTGNTGQKSSSTFLSVLGEAVISWVNVCACLGWFTGAAVIQILTVSPEKQKLQGVSKNKNAAAGILHVT